MGYRVIFRQNLAAAGRFVVPAISGEYLQLTLLLQCRSNKTAANNEAVRLYLNGDTTAANYSYNYIEDDGAGTVSGNAGSNNTFIGACPAATSPANGAMESKLSLIDPQSPDFFKSIDFFSLSDREDPPHWDQGGVLWKSISPVTSITIQPDGYPTTGFVAGSTLVVIGVFDSNGVGFLPI